MILLIYVFQFSVLTIFFLICREETKENGEAVKEEAVAESTEKENVEGESDVKEPSEKEEVEKETNDEKEVPDNKDNDKEVDLIKSPSNHGKFF